MKTDPSKTLDLAIVGGGINGASLAFLAARSGLSVALFEKDDWAQGTSSRSTKLIHGGIRYLEQVRLSLVREALKDRRSLLADAPHLVRPLPFLLPVYEGDERPAWLLRIGLNIYDRLAGKKNLKPHEWLSPIDALMVLENVIGARETGAYCVSGAEVIAASENPDGWQLTVRMPDGSSQNFSAHSVADATGPWANKTSRLWSGKEEQKVRPTRGSHIVVPRVLTEYAVLVMAPKEKRILFVIPWRGCTLVAPPTSTTTGNPRKFTALRKKRNICYAMLPVFFPRQIGRRAKCWPLSQGFVPWLGQVPNKRLPFRARTRFPPRAGWSPSLGENSPPIVPWRAKR
jgi:glycerol-3-phosphate dehydrogenase